MENIFIFIAGQIITAAAIWGSIRADIKNITKEICKIERSLDETNKRIDRHIERREM